MTDEKDFNYTAQARVPIMGIEWTITLWGENNHAIKKRIEKIVEMKDKAAPVPDIKLGQTTLQPQPIGATGNCPKCGAPMKISKQGKPYCSATCWLNAGEGKR